MCNWKNFKHTSVPWHAFLHMPLSLNIILQYSNYKWVFVTVFFKEFVILIFHVGSPDWSHPHHFIKLSKVYYRTKHAGLQCSSFQVTATSYKISAPRRHSSGRHSRKKTTNATFLARMLAPAWNYRNYFTHTLFFGIRNVSGQVTLSFPTLYQSIVIVQEGKIKSRREHMELLPQIQAGKNPGTSYGWSIYCTDQALFNKTI